MERPCAWHIWLDKKLALGIERMQISSGQGSFPIGELWHRMTNIGYNLGRWRWWHVGYSVRFQGNGLIRGLFRSGSAGRPEDSTIRLSNDDSGFKERIVGDVQLYFILFRKSSANSVPYMRSRYFISS